jgi:hypothetical protein
MLHESSVTVSGPRTEVRFELPPRRICRLTLTPDAQTLRAAENAAVKPLPKEKSRYKAVTLPAPPNEGVNKCPQNEKAKKGQNYFSGVSGD